MSSLKALLLSDGKPGHFHLAEGILAAAARLRPIDTHRVVTKRPLWLTPGLLWRLSTSGLSPAVILGYAYGLDATALPKPDLIVSAGGDTLAANVAAAKLTGAPNVFYGSLRRYRPEDFTLVLTSYARNADKPRHVRTLKPSRLDPDLLPRLVSDPARPPKVMGLLAGGDSGTVRFAHADWSRLLDFVGAMHKTHGTRWIVSNSPRTPALFSEALARLAAEPESAITELIDVRRTGTGTLQKLFGAAEAVVVTADSSSMLSEAVWARRPVIAVAPADMALPADEQEYRGFLETNGWVRSLAIAELTPESVIATRAQIRALDENPAELLTNVLETKLACLRRLG